MVHIYRPWHRPPAPRVMNKTVFINNQSHCHHSGGSGFWGGFLGGFLGGSLFNQGGVFSSLFGFGGGMPMTGGMFSTFGMGMPMTPFMGGTMNTTNLYGYLNNNSNQLATPDKTMDNLKTLYGDYTWIKEGDKYIGKKGDSEVEGTSLDAIRKQINGTDDDGKDLAKPQLTDRQKQETGEGIRLREASEFMSNPEVKLSGANIEPGKNGYILTYKGADGKTVTEEVETITDAYEKLGIKTIPANTDEGSEAAPIKRTQTASGTLGRSGLPSGWERTNADTETAGMLFGDKTSYKDCKTANDVLNHHLKTLGSEFNIPMDNKQLIENIIKYNPSVFNEDGTVKANANWDKLDMPNKNWLAQNEYIRTTKASAETKTTPKVDYNNVDSVKAALEAKGYKNIEIKQNFIGNYVAHYTNDKGENLKLNIGPYLQSAAELIDSEA